MGEGRFAGFLSRIQKSRARVKEARRGYTPMQRCAEKQVSLCGLLTVVSFSIPRFFGQEIGRSTAWAERVPVSLGCLLTLVCVALMVRYFRREQDEYARIVVAGMLLRSGAGTAIFSISWTLIDLWSGANLRSDYFFVMNVELFYIFCIFQEVSMRRRSR